MSKDKNLYEILGVASSSTQKEIKKAYHKLATKYHPDKAEGDTAEASEKFKEVSRAYEILSDNDKRARYDMFGDSAEGSEPDSDGFSSMRQKMYRKTKPMLHKISVTLEEIYTGTTKKIKVTRNIACKKCDNTGTSDKSKMTICRTCKGDGVITVVRRIGPFAQQVQMKCNKCDGKGKTIPHEYLCKTCDGRRIVKDEKKFEIEIAPGSRTGMPIVLEGEGEFHPDADEAGDIVIILEQEDHHKFIRKGDNLVYKKTISVFDALCGTKFIITHLDGSKIIVNTDKVINPDKKYYIRNVGLPEQRNPTQKGDMIIHFDVIYPEKIDQKKAKKLKELFSDLSQEKEVKLDTENYYEASLNEYNRDTSSDSDSDSTNSDSSNSDTRIPGMHGMHMPGMHNMGSANCTAQ